MEVLLLWLDDLDDWLAPVLRMANLSHLLLALGLLCAATIAMLGAEVTRLPGLLSAAALIAAGAFGLGSRRYLFSESA